MNILKIHCIIYIIIQKERVVDLDNEKDRPNTINDMNEQSSPEIKPLILNENDSVEVNSLLTLADSDITPDLLMQLEQRAKEEQAKMESVDKTEDKNQQEEIDLPEGLPAEDGAVNITGEIMERPKSSIPEPPARPVQQETMDPLEEAKMNAVYKKYVIYINKENENFIDSLTIDERKQLINNVLHEQNELTEAQRAERKRKEAVTKLILAIVTFLISVPVIYLIFNISMEATIQNYRHSKSNFEVLYKETGKIKLNN